MIKAGDKAPAFNLDSDEGGKVALKDFTGKKLVLYFYPRDNTPGCTRQAQAFTAMKKEIEKAGGAVVGVSRDSIASHQKFRTKCSLGITLVSDFDLAVHNAYGAWGEKTMYGKKVLGVIRSTFVIENGKVTKVFPNVKVDGHVDAVLAALKGTAEATLAPAKKKAAAAPAKKAPAKKVAAAAPKKKAATTKKKTKK